MNLFQLTTTVSKTVSTQLQYFEQSVTAIMIHLTVQFKLRKAKNIVILCRVCLFVC